MKLGKIQVEDLKFTGELEDDRTNTYLNLNDYDWMTYILTTRFMTDKYGELDVEFEYYGSTESSMVVTQTKNDKIEKYEFTYSTDIFKKHIINFLTNHIKQWKSAYAFNGENYVIEFYNEVIEVGKIR